MSWANYQRSALRYGLPWILITLLSAHWVAADGPAARDSDRPLVDVLAELQEGGLRLFFTSNVVRPSMRVRQAPTSTDPRRVLQQALAEHGLTTVPGPGGRLMVVAAGPANLGGVVRDRRSAKPLAGVRILHLDNQSGRTLSEVESDSTGLFQFDDVEDGEYVLEAHLPGYVIQRFETIEVAPHQTKNVVFELEATLLALDEIVVTPSSVSLLSSEPVAALDLDRDEILALPHLGDDVFRALTLLPGVTADETSARFNVRGGRSDEVLVLLDRVELYEPYHLKDFSSSVSIISPRTLQEVQLITGGYPARYGDRMGGVLEMTTRRPELRRHHLGLSILNVELGSAGRFADDRGRWLTSARRGALDLTLEFLGQDERPKFWDAFGKADYQLRPEQLVSAHVLYSDDRLEAAILEPDTFENFLTSYQNAYFWLGHQGVLNSQLFVDTTVSLGRVERDRRGEEMDFEGGSFDVRDKRRLDVLGLKQEWNAQLSDRNYWLWGFHGRHLESRYDYQNESDFGDALLNIRGEPRAVTERFQETLSGESYGLHVSNRWRLRDALAMEVGFRFDRHTVTDDSDLSPRFNLVFAPGKASTWRLALGHFHQSQRPYELQVEDGETALQSSERTEQSVLGFEHSFSVGRRQVPLLWRFEAYHRRVRDPRVRFENLFEPLSEFPEIEVDRFRLAPESSRAYGIEMLLKGTAGRKIDWWVSYAYARTTDRIAGRNVPRRIDQPHTINIDFNYRLGTHWNVNLAWRYHTGWPITGITGVPLADDDEPSDLEDADAEGVEDDLDDLDVLPIFGPLNGERLRSYHRLDLRASRSWQWERGTLGFFLEVQNVYDRGNLAGLDPEDSEFVLTPQGTIELRPEEEIWSGILPSFGITWEF